MQDTPSPKKPKNFLKERILRLSLVVFLKKNIVVVSLLLLFLISILVGIWNIRKYEIYDITGDSISSQVNQDIDKYLEENITGKNFFTIYSKNIAKGMENNLVYVENARVEKKLPNKLIVFLRLYQPSLVAKTKNSDCYLLSSEGIVLEKLCDGEGLECCTSYAKEKSFPFLTTSDVDIVNYQESKKKLLVMDSIQKLLGLVRKFGYMVEDITLSNNIVKIKEKEGRVTVFSVAEDLDIQLQRYYVVMGKIRQDEINWGSIDLRFERPVMKIR